MADGDVRSKSPRIARPLAQDFIYLCSRMSEDEQRQWCAVTGEAEFDADRCARQFLSHGPMQWVLVGADGLPIFAFGGNEAMPGVAQTWSVATADAWKTHWRSITKATRRMIDAGLLQEFRRVQTCVHAHRRATHVWCERGLGMVREGTLRAFNADGSDAVMFSRVREV